MTLYLSGAERFTITLNLPGDFLGITARLEVITPGHCAGGRGPIMQPACTWVVMKSETTEPCCSADGALWGDDRHLGCFRRPMRKPCRIPVMKWVTHYWLGWARSARSQASGTRGVAVGSWLMVGGTGPAVVWPAPRSWSLQNCLARRGTTVE